MLVPQMYRSAFIEAWNKGYQGTVVKRAAERQIVGACPCCGKQEVQLSDVSIIVGPMGDARQGEMVPQRVCIACAELDPEMRYTMHLTRTPALHTSKIQILVTFLLKKGVPTHLVAEWIETTFPSLPGRPIRLRAVEGQVVLLIEHLTPSQFNWIDRLVAQEYFIAVGVSTAVSEREIGRCPCGHVLRSQVERQCGRCLECNIAVALNEKDAQLKGLDDD
jgi:hypothetical protein